MLSGPYDGKKHGSLFSKEWGLSYVLGGSLWLLRKVERAWRLGPNGGC